MTAWWWIWMALFRLDSAAPAPDSLWAQANQAYAQERYEEALLYYDSILQGGYLAPELYYNMGNAYFRLGRNGWALAMFKKSRVLRDDRLTRRNIEMVYRRLGNPRRWPPPVIFAIWWERYLQWATPRQWAWGALAAGGLALLASLAWIWRRRRRLAYAAGVLWGVHLLGMASAWGRHHQVNHRPDAVVVVPSTLLYSAPSTESTGLVTLYEGDEVHITDGVGRWYEVQLPDGAAGWVDRSTLEPIGMAF